MKKVLLSLCSTIFLFSYTTQLAPVALQAHAQYEQEVMLSEKIAETIVQDKNGKYLISLEKVEAHGIQDKIQDVQQMVDGANTRTMMIENMSISLATLLWALVVAGLTWLANLILDYGLYLACSWYSWTMYNFSIRGQFNPASYWFYDTCRMKAWL